MAEQFTRKHRSGEVEYLVFTVAEAEASGLQYVCDWREARGNDWARTDDGYVVQCLKKLEVSGRGKRYAFPLLIFSCAAIWAQPSTKLEWEPRRDKRAWGTTVETWLEAEMKKTRFRRFVKMMAMMSLQGRIDWEVLGRAYRDDQANPIATAKRLWRREEVKKVVEEEISKICSDNGVTPDFIVKEWKLALQQAKEDKSPAVVFKGLAQMMDILRMTSRTGGAPQIPELSDEQYRAMVAQAEVKQLGS